MSDRDIIRKTEKLIDDLKSVLNKNIELLPLDINVELLPQSIPNTYTIKPSDKYEGFFIAKIKKIR